jgi:hypothetical protein
VIVKEHHSSFGSNIMVVVGRIVVVEVEVVEVLEVDVEVLVNVREVMRVVVLVGDCPAFMVVVVLELVVVLFVLCPAI